MSVVLLEKIPFIDFSTYVLGSIILLFAALFHVNSYYFDIGMLTHRFAAVFATKRIFSYSNFSHITDNVCFNPASASLSNFRNSSESFSSSPTYGFNPISAEDVFDEVVIALSEEPWCFWSVINIIYCILILLGKTIQNVVFGELRAAEQSHIRDKFWNFVFYKFIFVFGILYVNTLYQVLLWSGWYSILGFLHLLTHLTKDRFEFLMQACPVQLHFRDYAKLLSLLSLVLVFSALLTILSVVIGFNISLHNMLFMMAEIVLLCTSTIHVIVRFVLYLNAVDQDRSRVSYYVDLVFDMVAMAIDMAHHFHMLLWSNMFLSMASLVIFMQLRYLYYQIRERLLRHHRYRIVIQVIHNLCPLICDDGGDSSLCPICWEDLNWCRQLPCSHNFHENCLRLWLEQELACPTCRRPVTLPEELTKGPDADKEKDGEVMKAMLDQVSAVFPHLPRHEILADLRRTSNAESTIENILEGRLNIAYNQMPFGPQHIFFDRQSHEIEYSEYSSCVKLHRSAPSENLSQAHQRFEERKQQFYSQAREDLMKMRQAATV